MATAGTWNRCRMAHVVLYLRYKSLDICPNIVYILQMQGGKSRSAWSSKIYHHGSCPTRPRHHASRPSNATLAILIHMNV